MENRRQKLINRLLVWALGLGVAVFAWAVGNWRELPPELWEDIAVAAKVRPPADTTSLIWLNILSFFIGSFGVDASITVLKWLGPVSLGLLTVMTCRMFAACLPGVMKANMRRTSWGRRIAILTVLQGTLFFIFSGPVWRAGRVLSPEMFSLIGTVATILLALLAVEKSSMMMFFGMGALCGIMLTETPLAIVPPVILSVYLYWKKVDSADPSVSRLANPLVFTVSVRHMVWAMIVFWCATMALNIFFCRANGGIALAAGVKTSMMHYLTNSFSVFMHSASAAGWGLIFAVAVMPMLIAVLHSRTLTDVGKFMSLQTGCFYAAAGVFAYLQSTGLDDCHFWQWAPGAIRSRYILCLCTLSTSMLAMVALCVFSVDIYSKRHAKLLSEQFSFALEHETLAASALTLFLRSVQRLRKLASPEPLLALALIVPCCFKPVSREMSAIVNEIVRQTAEECAGADMLFSDGSLDAAVETVAFSAGRRLKVLSMMSGGSTYDTSLRVRGVTNDADRVLLSLGSAAALRTWVSEKRPCVSNIALQVGLELWRSNQLPVPKAGGLVSRTAGFPEGAAERYAERARGLAERILALYENGSPLEDGYPELNRFFLFGQWRLSRLCRLRANEADARADSAASAREHELADRLDKRNVEWQRVQEKMDWIGTQRGMRLTPREGLNLGLKRADFKLARSYARQVLASDDTDLAANFALGMGYFTEKQYGRAETHLKKCLVKAPQEPAVLNNLAIVLLRLERFDEAETNAVKALALLPDSPEIKTTLRHIRTARSEKDKGGILNKKGNL